MKSLTRLCRNNINSPVKKALFWLLVPIISLLLFPFIVGVGLTYLAWTKIQSKSIKLVVTFTLVTITLLVGTDWVLGLLLPTTADKSVIEESYINKGGLPENNSTTPSTNEPSNPQNISPTHTRSATQMPTPIPATITTQITPVPTSTKVPTDDKQPYRVVKVVDGDTIAVDINGVTESIRLIGIDTPETVDPRKPVQCFGIEASNKAKSTLNSKSVILETDNSQGNRDKYGRLLRYVYLEDGTNFNKLMIAEGYAFEYTYQTPYKYQTEFKQAELEAREAKRGLWADDTCSGNLAFPTTVPIPTPIPETPANTPTIPAPTPTTIPPLATCDCSGDIYNCSDFTTQLAAQSCFEHCGGIDNDIHRLDADKDGIACENLP